MAFFKRNKDNISNTIRTQTVIKNGKVVSSDDPDVKEAMENMEKTFGQVFGKGNFVNANSDPDDIAEFVENRLRMAGISNTGNMSRLENSFTSSNQPAIGCEQRIVICKGCGAKNTLTSDGNNICEYCGSGLDY